MGLYKKLINYNKKKGKKEKEKKKRKGGRGGEGTKVASSVMDLAVRRM